MPADFPSRLDLFALARDYVLSRATRIDAEQVDVAGSDVNIIVASASQLAYQIVLQLAERMNALMLDGAIGTDLDRLAFDRYQLTRKGASAAVVPLDMARPTSTVGAGTVPVGTVIDSLTGTQYVLTTPAIFGASSLTASGVNAIASVAGKDTQVGVNALTRFDNPGALFDPSLTVNNSVAAAGGEDTEDDDTFRERIRDFFQTARRGTLAAIEFGAKTVPGVVSAMAIEALDPDTAKPARVVVLYIADGSGVANAALAAQVVTALDDYRAGGISVVLNTSIPQIVDISLALTFQAGVDTTTLTTNIRAAVVEFVNSLPVNGPLYRAQLASVLQRYTADGLIPTNGTIASPTGDLIPDIGRTLRTTVSNVTVA
jgi:uncharacterized phage protein gp47/JayE